MKYLGTISFTTNEKIAKLIENEEYRLNLQGLPFNKSHFIRAAIEEFVKKRKE